MSIRLGLERILDLLKHLGNPQNDIKAVIHVAGTNGKGSVCALLSHALAATSIKVARFSSPHFITPTDSICINNTPIPDATYSNLMNRIKNVAESSMATDLPSSFEIECAIAFLWFSEQQVDVAVIEVGLGGRLDATNVFTNALCVFTALSIDHTEFLGSTIQEIATQKAGILHKPCSDCILGRQESFPESKAVIFAKAKEVGCQVWEVRDSCIPVAANIDASRSNLVKGRLLGQDIEIDLPLLGTFQYTNLATVLETLTVFYKHKYSTLFSVPPVSTLIRGLESTSWPGRMEWLAYTAPAVPAKKSIRFLADGAHNHQGAECLRAYLDAKYPGKSVHWVMGMKADREKMEGLVRVLVRGGDVVWSVGFEAPVGMPWIKSMPEDDIIKCVERIVPSVRECRVFKGGIREALDQLVDNERLIVVCGSLYLMASLHKILQ
ncbi:FolC bifunctional protein [Rhizoclosmatium globosum]|uniref:Dihydrofolate synthetase n=1 Tax=Rhizoclosmatium globosum TaxID=329046 RepID=A0A1Y2BNL2_9FUNG|nr:FolC bifunctional protein [Rhizoclosmatium globosum]|eukprot:ORY36340.1 FolC bifunctional protein [Rhizoclosmatium globosum]